MASIDELVSRIKVRLSRQQDSGIDARIRVELAAAQESLEDGVTLPWFLLTQQSYTVAGAHEAFSLSNFPGFIRIAEDDFGLRVEDLSRLDETLVRLTKQDTYGQLLRYASGYADATVLPEHYCVLGNTIHIRLKQAVSRTYHLSYYQNDATVPISGATTLWSANVPELLTAAAGVKVARYLRDDVSFQLFESERRAAYAEMVKRSQALQDADQSYTMDE